jgi:proline iminopeptidase
MLALYPDIKPYQRHRLAVQAPHVLYVEESGNPDGIPVLFVHGGPGAGCSPKARCFFDPEVYRIILFDQRGCGQSEPHACLDNNTTQALIEDMEAIREHLGVHHWVLFGGSWGSTLSIAYAQRHPSRVLAMILRGIFLCRPQELQWFYEEGGASRVFPDYWQEFDEAAHRQPGESWIDAYHRQLHGSNELARMSAAKAWCHWEGRCSTLRPNHDVEAHLLDAHTAVAMAHIENHFFRSDPYLLNQEILDNMSALANIPGVIVHGRYDMICPLDNAMTLSQYWPAAELFVVRDAGHSAFEPSMSDALVKATDEIAEVLVRQFSGEGA